MKKRIAASILAAAMAASALTACSGGNAASADGNAAGGTTAGESAESSAASQASGVITDGFADVDTNGVTVSFWHAMGGVNGEAMDYLVNKFNEENTDGITVEAKPIDANTFTSKRLSKGIYVVNVTSPQGETLFTTKIKL